MKRKIFELTVALYRVTDQFPEGEILKQQLRRSAGDVMAGVIEYGFFPRDPGRLYALESNLQNLRSLLGIAKISEFVKPINIAVLDREYVFFYGYFERELEMAKTQEGSKTTFSAGKDSVFGGQNDMSLLNDITSLKEDTRFERSEAGSPGHSAETSSAATAPARDRKKAFVEKSITFSERIAVNGNGNGHTESIIAESATKPAVQRTVESKTNYNERQRSIIDYIRVNRSVKSTDLVAIFSNRFSIKTLQRDLSFLIENSVIEREGDKRWAVYKIR